MTSKYDRVVRSDPRSPRYFKACDVARIAENCLEDTGTPEYIILACVAKRLGYQRVWVADKVEALHSDEYSLDHALSSFYNDVNQDYTRLGKGQIGFTVFMENTAARIADKLEEGISVEAATWLDALESGYIGFLNWVLWKIGGFFNDWPNVVMFWFTRWIARLVSWIGGMFEGLITVVSVDVDDVLRANPDWCTCMQPDLAEFSVDTETAKEYDKSMTGKKKPASKKKPSPVPINIS